MKVQTSLLGLIFLTSAAVYAQFNQPTDRRSVSLQRDTLDMAIETEDCGGPRDNIRAGTADSKPATISIQQLQHKVPKAGAKEFIKGREAFKKGNKEAAKEHLQKAIKIDPEFADAHNDLGVVLENLGEHASSAQQFRKAVQLAPRHKEATANLSIALYELKRYHEACTAANQAIKIEPGSLYIHYVLAICLIQEHRDGKEVLEVLQGSARQIPKDDR
jgi:tetratricopeptide (TPR) repeat protein